MRTLTLLLFFVANFTFAQKPFTTFSELSKDSLSLYSSIKVSDGYVYCFFSETVKINNDGKIVKKIDFKKNGYQSSGRIVRLNNRNFLFGIFFPIFDGTNVKFLISNEYRVVVELDDNLNILSEKKFQKLPEGYFSINLEQTTGVIATQGEVLKLSNDTLYSIQRYITVDSSWFPNGGGSKYEILDLKNTKTILTKELEGIGKHLHSIFSKNFFYALGDIGKGLLGGGGTSVLNTIGQFDLDGVLQKAISYDNDLSGSYGQGSVGQLQDNKLYLAYTSLITDCKTTTIDIRGQSLNLLKKVKIPDCGIVPSGSEPFLFEPNGDFYFSTLKMDSLIQRVALYKYDKNLNQIWSKEYDLSVLVMSLKMTDDNHILMECLAAGSSNNNYQIRLYKISKNGDITAITTLGTVNIPKTLFYPNPFQSQLSLQENIEGASEVQLSDINGRIVGIFSLNKNSIEVSSDLPKGAYIAQIKDAKGKILGQQMIIKQ